VSTKSGVMIHKEISMMKNIAYIFFSLVGILALTGCQTAAPDLTGTNWQLRTLNGTAVFTDTTITLQFGINKTAGGSDGCNRYGTTYTVSGSKLTFVQPMTSTMMLCPEEIMKQAAAFQKALAETNQYSLKNNQLTLLKGKDILAVFEVNSQEISGTEWQVTGYNNGKQAVVSTIIGTNLTAKFGQDGLLNGNGGCNTYSGNYETSGANITIGPLASTRKACAEPAGVMEQESQFLAAMQSAATYQIDGNILKLFGTQGETVVTFSK
jgi:heat shock protein HslJ